MKLKYIFGPVLSRRLGRSLGIDLIPYKTCSLDCIYCECGRTDRYTLERKEYFPTSEIIQELENYLSTSPEIDYLTFSGSGEPTLHSGIGEIIAFLKDNYPQYRIALLTNSTLFGDPEVRKEVKRADLIIPSLDAVSREAFRRINRPIEGIEPEEIIAGLASFRREFSGEIWLEIFMVPGINDTREEMELFKEAVRRIDPDKIQLNTLDRPGTESWVEAISADRLKEVAEILGGPVEMVFQRPTGQG